MAQVGRRRRLLVLRWFCGPCLAPCRVSPVFLAWACGRVAAASAMEGIELGLMPGELVLRGGMLKGPTVISGVKMVHGCGFVYLWKTSRWMNQFFAGKLSGKRPLACTKVPEDLQVLREQARADCLRGMEAAAEDCGSSAGKPDPTAALGFDAPAPAAAVVVKSSKRAKKGAKALLPSVVEVTLKKDGFEPWPVRLLLESVQKAVALEATVENLTALYLRVQADLAAQRKLRPRHGRGSGFPCGSADIRRKPPRHYEDGTKEYSVRNRWVRKFPLSSAEVPPVSANPSWKRVRTLKRRHTEDQVGPPGRGGLLGQCRRRGGLLAASGGAASAAVAPAGLESATPPEEDDPLGTS